MEIEQAKIKLKELVEQFKSNIKQYKSNNYDEANTRVDFIDKFFELLDWDVRNEQGFSEQYRDVVREDKVQIEGKQKAPDYSFRIGGVKKFFVEAKKPSVNIKDEIDPSYQIRRYGYTARLPLSILTDFEEFAIYDTRIKPDKNDKASVSRIFYCTYEEYEKHFEFIYSTFSKNAILKGSFDKYIEENKNKKGTSEVDKELFKLVEEWRTEIAKNIALRNPELDIYNLNIAVQKIIDRIIFLRIAEDKEIEDYGELQNICLNRGWATSIDIVNNEYSIFQKLNKIFVKANNKYNAGLFKPEEWLEKLNIDDKVLSLIIKGLYYPECPYEFSILPIEILGNIYEQFLGKTIRFRNVKEGHTAVIEEKTEVRKAGGVYYTPQYIVNYIIENTIGEKIKNKTTDEISTLKICDPACGSGSFLVGAYQYLLNYHLDYYTKEEKNLKKALKDGKIYQVSENNYKLTIEEKQRILINNIYGVDIDPQAVEVAKLSLYLKLLENEGKEAEGFLFKYSDIKLLPSLDDNIKCGNSLIGSDFYKDKDLSLFGNDEMRKVNAFDWYKEFPDVFRDKVIENKLQFYHIVFATHNSRIVESDLIIEAKEKNKVILSDNEKIVITKSIFEKIKEFHCRVIAYNILDDHIHMLLFCNEDDIDKIVGQIKGYSSRINNKINRGVNPSVDMDDSRYEDGTIFKLWAKGYSHTIIKSDEHLSNVYEYINNNHLKHSTQELNPELKKLIESNITQIEKAFDPFYDKGGFDVVIGNPPYGAELNDDQRKYLENKFKLNNTDTACLFIGLAQNITNENGIAGYIIPKPFIYASNWQKIRENVFNNLTKIVDCGKVWKEVKLEQSILTLDKSKKIDFYLSSIRKNQNIETIGKIDKNTFKQFGFYLNGISDKELEIGKKILKTGSFLNDFCTNQRGVLYQKEIVDIPSDYKVLGGKQISRYFLSGDAKGYISKKVVTDDKAFIRANSILVQNIVAHIENPFPHIKIIATIPEYFINKKEYIILDTINQLTIREGCSHKYILAIINSKVISWYVYRFIFGLAIRTMHFDNTITSRIPIPENIRKNKDQDSLVSLVDQMLELQKLFHNAKTESNKNLYKQKIDLIDNQIDNLVYKLYGLTEEEVNIVEEDS